MGYLLLALSALALAAAGFLWHADTQERKGAGQRGVGSDASATDATAADASGVVTMPAPREHTTPDPQPQEAQGEGVPADEGWSREGEAFGTAQPAEPVKSAESEDAAAAPLVTEAPEAKQQAAGETREAGQPQEATGTREAAKPQEATEPREPAKPQETAEPREALEAQDASEKGNDEHEEPAEEHGEPAEETVSGHSPRQREKTHSRWGALSGAIGSALPGAKQRARRERREWAEANGFEYSREDEFLQDEWGRGAASAGEPVRDVLTGTRFGHETRIANIGETTVVAMGTGMDSGVVVDMRRKANAAGAHPTEDLVAVAELEGFRVFASEAGPAERMLDIRVTTALEMLPPQVSAVWCETEWVLAQLDHTPGAQEWEPVFAPLALLADAARTLPPRTWPHLHLGNQTREMGEPVEAPASAKSDDAEHARPIVARPEEPLELPTRTTGAVRGTMEYRTIGGDEVDAIATGEPPERLNDGTRLTRRPQPPSIFGDGDAD